MSRSTTITAPRILAMVEAAGGVGALAASLRVGTATIHRWGALGVMPKSARVREAANAWARRRGLEEPF